MEMKDRIKRIQKFLGVESDGEVGPKTITAAEKRIGLIPKDVGTNTAKGDLPAGNQLAVSERSLERIVFFEVSSERFYERKLSNPCWPGVRSGVTIGIGYDLGYNTKTAIDKDWRNEVSESDLTRLKSVAGIKGNDAKGAARSLRDIKIGFPSATKVFYTDTLPRYAALTRKTYPGVEKLPADAQGALLSVIFNRGAKLTGTRRREMAAIKPLVAAGDLDGIADQIVAMRRLWPETKGLLKRRADEAELVRKSRRRYSNSEVILV